MKNKVLVLFLSFLVVGVSTLSSFASYYYDDGSNENNPNIDKFRPQSGVKIKESGLARMMENATARAMKGKSANIDDDYEQNREIKTKEKSKYLWF